MKSSMDFQTVEDEDMIKMGVNWTAMNFSFGLLLLHYSIADEINCV